MAANQQMLVAQKIAAGGGGYTLLNDYFTSQTGTWQIGDTSSGTADHYAGLKNWNNASARNIGKVTAKISLTSGTIVGKTYVCRIWTMSGSNLGVNVATSVGVAGSDSWSATSVDFIFTVPYTTTGSTNYAITIDCGAADPGTNYASGFHTTPQIGSGDLNHWSDVGVETETFSAYNMQLKIYTSP